MMKKHALLLLFVSLIISTSFSQISNLVAYYPFSGNAVDETNNGNDGVVFGDASLTTDRFGNPDSAYLFDGINDYINTFSTFDFEYRSLSLWIQPYSVVGSGGTSDNTLIHVAVSQDDSSLEYGCLRIGIDNSMAKLWAGGVNGTCILSPINVNEWYHLVLVRDGSSTIYYSNGVKIFESTSDTFGSTYNPNNQFIIGCGRSTTNQFYKGKIDDIRIFDKALSNAEVLSLYNESSISVSNLFYKKSLTIYPNPSDGLFNLTNKSQAEISINVYDEFGRRIYTMTSNKRIILLDLRQYTIGLYFLEINTGDMRILKKLIKL